MAPPPPAQRRAVRGISAAVSFGVYADLAANMYSATNSSPQTTELFAGERSVTLWKYVRIGHLQALVFGIIGTILDRSLWPLIGTFSIGAIMHCMYSHAMKAGSGVAPPTNATPLRAHAHTGRGRSR